MKRSFSSENYNSLRGGGVEMRSVRNRLHPAGIGPLIRAAADRNSPPTIMHTQLAFLNVGGPEMIAICAISLLLFGSENLPKLARGIGKTMAEFQKAKDEFEQEITRVTREVSVSQSDPIRPVEPPLQLPDHAELEAELATLQAQAEARKLVEAERLGGTHAG
jgi:TatA/E family protein of Tat protein translocase